jgi:hypothetical protein
MKALVMALFLFTNAISYALGEILTPAIVDPHLIWVWAGPAIALAVQTVIFHFRYRKFNDDDFMIYNEPVYAEKSLSDEGSDHHAAAPNTIPDEGPMGEKDAKEFEKL